MARSSQHHLSNRVYPRTCHRQAGNPCSNTPMPRLRSESSVFWIPMLRQARCGDSIEWVTTRDVISRPFWGGWDQINSCAGNSAEDCGEKLLFTAVGQIIRIKAAESQQVVALRRKAACHRYENFRINRGDWHGQIHRCATPSVARSDGRGYRRTRAQGGRTGSARPWLKPGMLSVRTLSALTGSFDVKNWAGLFLRMRQRANGWREFFIHAFAICGSHK